MSVGIGLGLALLPFPDARGFWRFVDLCEERGVDSLWQSDRLVSRQPYLETMSLLAALAGRTERIKFGMNVVVLPLRDPLVLAKECATIDFLSDGRLLPAFGVGGRRAGRTLPGPGLPAPPTLREPRNRPSPGGHFLLYAGGHEPPHRSPPP